MIRQASPGVAIPLLAVGLSLVLGPTAASADESLPRGVVVSARVLMAKRSSGSVSRRSSFDSARRLVASSEALARSLSMFPYDSYRLIQYEKRAVVMHQLSEFPVPGGRRLFIQPTAYGDGRVSMNVMLLEGEKRLVNTVLRLRNRGEFVVAGPEHEGGVLFLSIGATVPEVAAEVWRVGSHLSR